MSACYLSGKTRSWKGCSGPMLPVEDEILRCIPGVSLNDNVCRKHYVFVRRENSRRCSCPAPWSHSTISERAVPTKFYAVFDEAGKSLRGYRPGTRGCNRCKSMSDKAFFPEKKMYIPPSKRNVIESCIDRDRSPLVSSNLR